MTLELLEISIIMFAFSLASIIVFRYSLIHILIEIELLLLSVNLNFILISLHLDDAVGLIFSLFILVIAAAESAIALALLVIFYRKAGSININLLQYLKS